MQRILVPGALLLLLITGTPIIAKGQEIFSVESTQMLVYRDGVVEVRQILQVNETFPEITVTLVSSDVGSVLVVDERSIPLNYDLIGFNMTIHTLGASKVTIVYQTQNLTRKEASVWTITFRTPYNLNVILPENSTVIYLNDLPTEISVRGDRPVLLLETGDWEISYVLPLPVSTTTTTTTGIPPLLGPIQPPLGYSLAAIAAGLGLIAVTILVRRGVLHLRRKALLKEELRPDEREVLQFISERGGKVFETELRGKFLLPKTSMWRLVRRLERRGLVKVRKVGLQNEIELVK